VTERPLKILLTDPHLKGGGQVRYVFKLAAALTRLGQIVTIGCKPDSVLRGAAEEAECGLLNSFYYRSGLHPFMWWSDLRTVQHFIRDEQPDILHANGSQDHWVNALGNRLIGRPVCMVRSRHNTYAVSESWPNRVLNLDWTDYQIAVCEAVRQLRVTRPVFDADRMCTIHNGIDPDEFLPDLEARARVRQEFGYGDDNVVLGMAARLTVAKGHTFLFQAVEQLRSEYPNIRLLLLGQGDLEAALKQEVKDRRLDDIATFPGFRNDIGDCIQAFDVGVQPSIDCEASSFSVMEQMATEKPIVASDHGGTQEIVHDGQDGFIVPQGTVEPLRDRLRELIADQNQRRVMGQSARQRVSSEFTVDLLAQRTVAAYRHALDLHTTR
jgi:glycosyltransferase involved in cell wall biosynthesis